MRSHLKKAGVMTFQLTANKVEDFTLTFSNSTNEAITVLESARGGPAKGDIVEKQILQSEFATPVNHNRIAHR